jgi:transcriptional regulator with XRE-family HTH domain
MAKRFQSAAEAAAFLADNEEVEARVEKEVLANRLVTALIHARIEKGYTQKDVALAMGCNPSKISKIEAGTDQTLKWSDVVDYLSALNVGLTVFFEDGDMPAAERIKSHVFRIHSDLESLAELAKQYCDDPDIPDKIHQFYGEVLFNFIAKFQDSYGKLGSIVIPSEEPTQSRQDPESDSTEGTLPGGQRESVAQSLS